MAYLVDTVYIVCRRFNDGLIVESVWTTEDLAKSAIHYHALDSHMAPEKYVVVSRDLNTAKRSY